MEDLIEAYRSVYTNELNEAVDSEGRAISANRLGSNSNGGPQVTRPTSSTSATKPTKPTKATKPTKTTSYGMEEEFDTYDVILNHLLDEGFADTEQNAITIMANMSEAWIDEILDEAQIMSVSGPGGLKHMINPNVLKLQNAAAKEAQGRKARETAAKEAKNADRLTAATKKGIEAATNRSDRTDFTPGSALRANERDEQPTDYRARRRRASGR
jgi:hypothetical protein